MFAIMVFTNADIINEILTWCDNKTTVSILCVGKVTSTLAHLYKDNIFKYAITRELKYVYNNTTAKYIKYKIGDRVYTDEGLNYKITYAHDKIYKMNQVDTLGNDLGLESQMVNVDMIKTGILLGENGPKITNVNSIYLKHKIFKIGDIPEINMLVRVKVNNDLNRDGSTNFGGYKATISTDYMIIDIGRDGTRIRLQNINAITYVYVDSLLIADKVNNRWVVTNHNHRIIYDYIDQY